MSTRTIEWARIIVLGAGVISSWTALLVQFREFYAAYGTFLHASTSVATNPFLTPCLYGSLAFLGAFVWASLLHLYPSSVSERWLSRLLLFGVVFAALAVGYDCATYFRVFSFGVPLVCNPDANPFATACFRGLIFFIAAYVTSLWLRSKKQEETPAAIS